uniref:Uncharacterized protein n=1 Tax=Fagus sylvatica TaxID=28930 RepID=A0A2N9FZF1_FAGSY
MASFSKQEFVPLFCAKVNRFPHNHDSGTPRSPIASLTSSPPPRHDNIEEKVVEESSLRGQERCVHRQGQPWGFHGQPLELLAGTKHPPAPPPTSAAALSLSLSLSLSASFSLSQKLLTAHSLSRFW